MKIGVCGNLTRASIIKSLGYDYIEENLSKIVALTDKEFLEKAREYEKLGLPVYAFNAFFAPDMTIYGEDSLAQLQAYGRKAFLRAYELGGSVCVIGSGKARRLHEGTSRVFADERFAELLSFYGDIAAQYGIRIAVEPLNKGETNYINTVSEAADAAKRADRKNVGALVDFYHFFMENESDEGLLTVKDSLFHAHIARPNPDRKMPRAEDAQAVGAWAELLKKAGYSGAISVEARYENFEEELREGTKYIELFSKV